MRVAFVVDGRSPIARTWIEYFLRGDHQVHLISTAECNPMPGVASQHVVSVAFSGTSRGSRRHGGTGSATAVSLKTAIRQWLGPFTLAPAARRLRRLLQQIQPELVHAQRIPFEGMLAAAAVRRVPLLVSSWGNDFSLHARSTPWMARRTRKTLQRADAFHADCRRDASLARTWGLAGDKPTLVMPGNGGVRSDIFFPGEPEAGLTQIQAEVLFGEIDPKAAVVVNPRGFRAYVRNDTFFKSLPLVLRSFPETTFLCPAMAGERAAERWQSRMATGSRLQLFKNLSPQEMAAVFRRAQVMVSASEHDGTPNTFLEAIACGTFPVVGDIESLREWVEDGKNGLLIDPGSPEALGRAVIRALEDPALRRQAARRNLELIKARADYERLMPEAEAFYRRILARSTA